MNLKLIFLFIGAAVGLELENIKKEALKNIYFESDARNTCPSGGWVDATYFGLGILEFFNPLSYLYINFRMYPC